MDGRQKEHDEKTAPVSPAKNPPQKCESEQTKKYDVFMIVYWSAILIWIGLILVGFFLMAALPLTAKIVFALCVPVCAFAGFLLKGMFSKQIDFLSKKIGQDESGKDLKFPPITCISLFMGAALFICMATTVVGFALTDNNTTDPIGEIDQPPDPIMLFFDFKKPEPFETAVETMEAMLNTLNDATWEYKVPDDLVTVDMTKSEALCALMPEYSTVQSMKYRTLKDTVFAEGIGIYARARQDYNTGKITREQWKDILEKTTNAAVELTGLLYAQNQYDSDLNRQIALRYVDTSDLYVQSNDLKNAMDALEKGIQQVLLSVLYMRKSGSTKADMYERLRFAESYYFGRLSYRKHVLGVYIYQSNNELYRKYETIQNAITLLLEHDNYSRINDLPPPKD